MSTVIFFKTKESWRYEGIDENYPCEFAESLGAVIAKGNNIEGIEAKE